MQSSEDHDKEGAHGQSKTGARDLPDQGERGHPSVSLFRRWPLKRDNLGPNHLCHKQKVMGRLLEVWTGQPPPGSGRRSPAPIGFEVLRKVEIGRFSETDPESPRRDLISGAREKNLTVFAICPWPNPVSNRHHADLNAPTKRGGHMSGKPTIRPCDGIQASKRSRSNYYTACYGDLW